MCRCHAPASYAVAYNEITIAILLLHVIIVAAMHACLNIAMEGLGNTAWHNHRRKYITNYKALQSFTL